MNTKKKKRKSFLKKIETKNFLHALESNQKPINNKNRKRRTK